MIKLKLIRTKPLNKDQAYTEGELFVQDGGGNYLDFCYTLEDKVRDFNMDGDLQDPGEEKVFGETAIPFGIYSGFLRFSPNKQRIVPELENVPGFKNVQIHAGNTAKDSLGCILSGYETDNKGSIWESRKAEADLVKLIEAQGGKFTIQIT